ncbi:MAG: YciI family protein, partial [Polyangia bacterium]
TVTDGPFAEAKEVLGGYALLKAGSREEVVALCRRFLNVTGQGTCQVYELFQP